MNLNLPEMILALKNYYMYIMYNILFSKFKWFSMQKDRDKKLKLKKNIYYEDLDFYTAT